MELLVEYKFYEPAFYATDLADWGSALLVCQELGDRAKVLVDLGHHAQGVNIEQIVSLLHGVDRLGGFHFNDRKYGDDDLIVGSIDPFQLFRIFFELIDAGAFESGLRFTIDQSHNIEPKIEAMIQTVLNLQEAYAKALLVDRAALERAQARGRHARRQPRARRRLQHRRSAAVREGAHRPRRGRRPDRLVPRRRLRRPASRRHAPRERQPHGSDRAAEVREPLGSARPV